MRKLVLAVTLAGLCGLLGCSASHQAARSPGSPASRSTPSPSPSFSRQVEPTSRPSSPTPRQPAESHPNKVLVVIEENHSLDEMRAGMPFLASMSERYGYATHWQALAHPSEPDYLGIVGGSTFGVSNDEPPADNATRVGDAASVFSQALEAGKTAATFAESMGTPCALVDTYPYAVRHNPWTFFADQRDACRAHDLDAGSFASAARANLLPDVGLLIPDVLHDAHDGSLQAADAWLRSELTPVLASTDFRSGELVVVVTADEDDSRSGNIVLTSVLTPRLHHRVVSTVLTHYSLTRFIDEILGVTPLGRAADAPDMASAFGL